MSVSREHRRLGQSVAAGRGRLRRRAQSEPLRPGNGLGHVTVVGIVVLLVRAVPLEPVREVSLATGGRDQAKDALVHVHEHPATVTQRAQDLLFPVDLVAMVL